MRSITNSTFASLDGVINHMDACMSPISATNRPRWFQLIRWSIDELMPEALSTQAYWPSSVRPSPDALDWGAGPSCPSVW